MRDWKKELDARVEFIRGVVKDANARGIVFNNSGGKDSALAGILCKKACDNTVALMLPCHSNRNYGQDMADALELCRAYSIDHLTADLTSVRDAMIAAISTECEITDEAKIGIVPRLRMTAGYAVAQSRGYLLAGTGNRSEEFVGYFTKWGDGAYDFNPIADLTVTEIYKFLRFLGAPKSIMEKAPSAGLYAGQTDEGQLGVTYRQIDSVILGAECDRGAKEKILDLHAATEHKRVFPPKYGS